MQIKILVANKYNNADRTALECEVGDVLETSAAYGALLIEKNLAEAVEVDALPTAKPKGKKSSKGKTPPPGTEKTPTPFVA